MDEPGRRRDSLYETDFFRWTQEQAERLRRAGAERVNAPLDWENLAEEIESLGRRDRREATSLLSLILIHLVKLAHSPRSEPRRGWIKELRAFRKRLDRVLRDSPSLAARVPDFVSEERGRVTELTEGLFLEQGEPVDEGRIAAYLDALPMDAIRDEAFIPDPPEPLP
ncbi:DUF29 domain-containing protein [Salinarimonas soli]|nr:DUF29 domain-containing protein [Salinarimonas soli]